MVVPDAQPECTDRAVLFLPVEASDVEPWVDARRLHQALGVGKAFRAWIAGRIESSGFVEGTDFIAFEGLSRPDLDAAKSRSQKTKEYSLTLDMAKHLALLERNEQGALVRRYFIACEKKLKERQRADMVPARALTQSNSTVTLLCEVVHAGGVNLALTEEAKQAATARAEKAEQALADVTRQPGLSTSLVLARRGAAGWMPTSCTSIWRSAKCSGLGSPSVSNRSDSLKVRTLSRSMV